MDPKQALNDSQDSAPVPDDPNGVNDQVSPPDFGEAQEPEDLQEPLIPQEPVDENGVPYRNRLAEKDRKLVEAQTRLKAYEDMLAKQQTPPTQAQKDEFEELLEQVDPATREFMKKFISVSQKKLLGTMNQILKTQSEQRVVAAHHELLDPNSDLAKQVQTWAATMRTMGIDPSTIPNGLESIVNTITRTAPRNGQPKPQPSKQPIPQGGNNFFTPGKPPAKTEPETRKMPQGTSALAKAMGLGDKSLKRLDQRYKQGDFDLGGGK
uniref:Uncharacterized protein n=1 Tax=viral metagenome TaxID=1070528 RepID=A0A6M3KW70_9ZZZZ